MAEAIHDEHSPLADFLRRALPSSSPPLSPSRVSAESRPAAHPSTEPPSPPSAGTPHHPSHAPVAVPAALTPAAPPAPKRTRRQLASIERVKYAIATSALLSAKLADALQVYPPLTTLEQRAPGPRPARSRSSSVRKANKVKHTAAEWGAGWETRGQGVTERGVLGSAQAALAGLAGLLGRASSQPAGDSDDTKEGMSGSQPPEKEQAPQTPQGALLATVDDFIASSQELDLRIAAALTAIKELECISHGLGLSDPLPPISRIEARGHLPSAKPPSPTSTAMVSTPSRSPRIPSPLGGPSRASLPLAAEIDASPLPLRALALRTALADALADALSALATATTSLNALLPRDSPLLTLTAPSGAATPAQHAPTASLSELLRHDTLARAERSELARWEEASAPASSRPASVHLGSDGAAAPAVLDPFHPTESTFGGIERRAPEVPAAGTPQRAAHRLRASLGPHGSPSPRVRDGADVVGGLGGPRRKRPLSMGGLASATATLDSAALSSPAGSNDGPRELLVALQDAFEDAHDARRGVLWRLLEALDHAADARAWVDAERALDKLAAALTAAARRVAAAHEREFCEGTPAMVTRGGAGSSHEQGEEKRRRSGFYGRAEADSAAASAASPARRGPPLRPAAAAAYDPFAPSVLLSAGPAHARAGSAVAGTGSELAAHVQRAALALRAAQAKMRVVLADAAVGVDEAERGRVLALWESVGDDVRRLEEEWKAGGEALRSVLGVDAVTSRVEREERERAPLEVQRGGRETPSEEADADDDDPNATGAVYATLDTSDAPGTGDDDVVTNRQAVLDAALSLSLLPPDSDASSPTEEKVFEAVAGPHRRSPAAGEKLSRDERIRRMKEAREALALGRSSLESPSKGSSDGGVEAQRNMVGELREVLKELNRDKVRLDTPSAPAMSTQPQFIANPQPPPFERVTTPPPQPMAHSSPPAPQHASLPPPSQFATPPPAQSFTSPAAARPPGPPLARRPSQPHAAARYSTPPTAPATPGKQPMPRYVSPPPSSRPHVDSSAAPHPYQHLPPPVPVPITPSRQPAPRYAAPPGSGSGSISAGAARGALPQAPTHMQPPQPRYGPPPVAHSPVRAVGIARPSAGAGLGAQAAGGQPQSQPQPQRVKRPSVQTV
ncbi:hypothetical protein JCM3770_004988 [Rhodotorula araucariae]